MKILIACSAPPGGGSGISAYSCSLAGAMIGLGHEVHYASPVPLEGSPLRSLDVKYLSTDHSDEPLDAMKRLLAHARAEGIQGFVNNDNSVLQSLAPGLPAPLVSLCHMDRRTIASLCALHVDWTDHLVCISNDMKERLISHLGVPVTKCTVVHNGAPDPGHHGGFDLRDGQRLRLVFAGGWSKEKGGPRLMASLKAHPEVWSRVRLDWFDTVPAAVQRAAVHLPDVHFHGRVPQQELHRTLAEADALVFGSEREGCPMLMLEAMSFGVLPIAADGVGAMRWLIDHGHEGFICSLREWPRQLAECVSFLADRPEGAAAMKRAARERYLAEHRAETNAERILALLARPTVDRRQVPESWRVVRWHRLPPAGTREASWVERLRYRSGRLEAFAEMTARG